VTGTTELSREQLITINQIIEGYDKAKAPGTGYVTKIVIHPVGDLSVDVVFHIGGYGFTRWNIIRYWTQPMMDRFRARLDTIEIKEDQRDWHHRAKS